MVQFTTVSGLWVDFRYSLKRLLRSPSFAAFAVISLALAIGANSAVFSVIDALFFRALPVPYPAELVQISSIDSAHPEAPAPLLLSTFQEIHKRRQFFAGVFAWDEGPLRTIEAKGVRYPGGVVEVSGEFFGTLGIKPVLGRLITPDDVSVNGPAAHVAVLDYRCWRNRFGADPRVIGQLLRVNGIPLVIIGVTPESFSGINVDLASDALVPIGFEGATPMRTFNVGARMGPHITREQGAVYLESIWPSVLEASIPPKLQGPRRASFLDSRLRLDSLEAGTSEMRSDLKTPLTRLAALGALVLIVAWINLGALVSARVMAARHELGIRSALGGSISSLIRLVLIETLLISLSGAALALAAVSWTGNFLLHNLLTWQPYLPLALNPRRGFHVTIFAIAITVATGIICASVPVLDMLAITPMVMLRGQSQDLTRHGMLYQKVLTVSHLALSLVLTISATLFAKSLLNINNINPGFDRKHVLTMELFPEIGRTTIPNPSVYYHGIIDGLCRIPTVLSASYAQPRPLDGVDLKEPVARTNSPNSTTLTVHSVISPGLFRTMRMQILEGRDFDWSDDAGKPPLAIISDSLARNLFPGTSPIGQRVTIGEAPRFRDLEIVGVTNSASLWRLQSYRPEAIYTALLQSPNITEPQLQIRTSGDPMGVASQAKRFLESLGYHTVIRFQTLDSQTERALSNERLISTVAFFSAVLTILLALAGLYGFISYLVTKRVPEIGIRLALGASRQQIVTQFLKEALVLASWGILIGVPTAIGTMQTASSVLFGISPTSPKEILLSAAFVGITALGAAYLPARRASLLDPIVALRNE